MNVELETPVIEEASNTKRKAVKRSFKAEWGLTVGLILLSLVPVLAGASRVTELAQGAEITEANARFFASPIPVLIHIVASTLYAILGAFQFAPSLRRSKERWHRLLGRFLMPFAFASAFSGLWMAHFYPWPKGDGEILYVMRLVFGAGMVLSLALGLFDALKRDFKSHEHWMMRAYAIGLGAGTQVFTHIPWFIFFGQPDELPRAVLMGAGWVINLAVVEWFIYQQNAAKNAKVSRLSPNLR